MQVPAPAGREPSGEEILGTVNLHLQAQGVRITTGTIVDAILIHAPSSTKNREQSRDPEMHQAKKGKNWYFGMKAHVGVDSKTKHHSHGGGIAHCASETGSLRLLSAGPPLFVLGKRYRQSGGHWNVGARDRSGLRFCSRLCRARRSHRVRFTQFAPQEKQWEEKAFQAADKALSLDPKLAEAHVARGLLLWTPSKGFQHKEAIQEYRRALI